MRRFAVWGLVGCGMAGTAAAQQPLNVQPNPTAMPGTPVGKPLVQPVGSTLPKAAPAVGAPVGTGPGGLPTTLDPRAPKPVGQQIDLKNVIAPYPGMPKPPPSFWEQITKQWFKLFESDTPAVRPNNWTPGIGRRNRERKEERLQMWRRG
jgi:hypothetical protein